MSTAINIENPQAASTAFPSVDGHGTDTPPELMTALTIENLRRMLQETGYRVEIVREGNVTLLRSATNGLAFDVRLGSGYAGMPEHHADMTLVALFAVRGALPLDLVNEWNRTRRFARLFLDQPAPGQDFLIFSMDVSVAGGVTARQLRAQIEIWDSLVQQLIPWLREALGKLSPANGARPGDASTELQAPAAAANSANT